MISYLLRLSLLLSISIGIISNAQTPQLFFEDGGDLGPLEIREGNIYYIDHEVGLKELLIADPAGSDLIVETAGISDITHIFWGVDGAQVYFGNTFEWYKSPFDPNEVHTASFLRDFSGQYNYEIKQYNDVYLFSITDFGTFIGILVDIDPFNAGQGGGFINSSSRNLGLQGNTVYFSHTPSGTSAQNDFALFRGVADDFNDTQELLFDFNEPIGQIEVSEQIVYVVLRNSNTIMVFDASQDALWTPLQVIDLDEGLFTLENIVINEGDIYFTDSAQGNIYIIDLQSLGIQNNKLSSIQLYPNPVSDYLHLEISQSASLSIFDIQGKQLLLGNYSTEENLIDFSSFESGIYFMEIMFDGNTSTHKIIKK